LGNARHRRTLTEARRKRYRGDQTRHH
jgi:hypothetical protein